jgi:hypothetical protein
MLIRLVLPLVLARKRREVYCTLFCLLLTHSPSAEKYPIRPR